MDAARGHTLLRAVVGVAVHDEVGTAGADLVVHGHAHHGREKGVTPGGIHVRNVAQPVLRRSYAVYCLGESGDG